MAAEAEILFKTFLIWFSCISLGFWHFPVITSSLGFFEIGRTMGIQAIMLCYIWDLSSDSVTQVNRNRPPKETKRMGTYEIPVRLHQTFLLKSFVLHTSSNTAVKCALVILTVPFSAMSLCCRCQKCFERNYNDFWKLVSSSGKEILLLNLWDKAFMRSNHCRVFGN